VICPLAIKKLHNCPGKQKQFNKLLGDFFEVYERKKIEKIDYNTKNKKEIEERPCIPNSAGIIKFKKI
jgi:hypothetical protein